jgi:type IV pilus assembly protein PilC
MGNLIEKNIMARTTRTLGTLVTSGVPILEGLNITRETSGNAMFERMYGKVTDSIREGNTVARPMKEFSKLGFHPMCAFFWFFLGAIPGIAIMMLSPMEGMSKMLQYGAITSGVAGALATLFYLSKINNRVVDDLVVNMVDVGEETGELDTMLYKVADTYDEEVKTLTDGLMALLEPLMICFLGGAVGFIVISLFMPLVSLIQGLS